MTGSRRQVCNLTFHFSNVLLVEAQLRAKSAIYDCLVFITNILKHVAALIIIIIIIIIIGFVERHGDAGAYLGGPCTWPPLEVKNRLLSK